MAEKKKYNSTLVSGRKDQTLTYSKYIKDEESGESVKESLDKKVNATDKLETQQIKDGAITNEKLAADSVSNTNLQDGSVSNEKLEDGSITNDKLAENSITKDKLQDKTIGVEKLDNELRQAIAAATGLPEDLVETIQNVDDTLKDHQSQLDDKQQQITANDEDISLLQTRSTQMEETIKGIAATGGASVASAVTYDNTTSQLTSVNIQGAVDELQGSKIDKTSILQESGDSENKVISQKAVSDKLSDLSSEIENTGVRTINVSEDNIVLNKYITTRGDEGGSHGYFYSKPITVKKGDKVVYKGVGDGCIAISTSDSTPTFPVTPIVTSISDGNIYTYEYIVEEDGFVVISGLWSGFKSLLMVDSESVCGNITKNESDITALKASMNKVDGSVKDLSVGLESFKGKTILCLGDSITHDGAYTTPLSSLLGAKIINRGSSGSSIAIRGNNISFVERVQLPQSDESGTAFGMPTKADVVIFYGGANDWMASTVDFGTTNEGENTATFCGSVFFVFNKLKQYYPNASFFVVNNYNVYSPNVFPTVSEIKYADNEDGVYEYVRNTQGKTFDDYRNAIIEISKLFGFKMIDLKNIGFSFFKNEDREKYSFLNNGNYDGLHPNKEAGKLMAKYMAKQMCNAVTVQKELEGRLREVESSNDKLFLSTGLFETIPDSYVEEDGSINYQKNYKRTSYIRCDTAKYVIITSSVKDSKFNAFYDKDKKFISTFFTAYWNDNIKEAGNRNVIKVPDGACYYIVSNTNAGFEGTVIKNSLEYDPISTSRIYDVYIASKGSKYAKFADYVTDGVNDQDMINSIISDSGVNSIYIYGDSTFLLSAPIKVKDNFKIKSNGATFNNIDMITHKIVSSATTGNQVVLDSTEGFRIGMWLYFEDDKGNNDWNVITRIDKTTPPKITLKNNIKNVWDKEDNPVVKSANMCFLLDKVQNVEIDGVVVDWNVDNNPIQKYNPTYLQEAFTLNDSTNIVIRNCIGKNGGRRGLCTHDTHRVLIENCTFYNWKEHGIDLFNSYTENGNTREYPFLTDTVVTNCRCYDNAMAGIQNHRGSGCLINKCELFNNNYGVSAQEYAHDIVVSDCLIHDNKLQQVYVRQDSYNISILGCIIAGSVGWEGVEVYNARKVLISNNQINNNSRAGIALINGKMCKIHGNILSANNKMITKPSETGLYSAQVSISDNSDRNVISDNFIHLDNGGSNYGVWEDGSDYNTVYENDFVGMKVESVKLTGSNSSKRNNREYSS